MASSKDIMVPPRRFDERADGSPNHQRTAEFVQAAAGSTARCAVTSKAQVRCAVTFAFKRGCEFRPGDFPKPCQLMYTCPSQYMIRSNTEAAYLALLKSRPA
jgi:hypothetical protein